jgi:hypothetical protein
VLVAGAFEWHNPPARRGIGFAGSRSTQQFAVPGATEPIEVRSVGKRGRIRSLGLTWQDRLFELACEPRADPGRGGAARGARP